jgi:tetratricopeptide (TPR) repeat protein
MRWKSGVTTLALVSLLAACSTPSTAPDANKDSKSLAQIRTGADSTPRDKQLKEGLMNLQKGDYEKAKIAFHTSLNGKPNDALMHFMAGLTAHMEANAGKTDSKSEAEVAYKASLANDPANKLASLQLARLYMEEKNYAKAQDSYAEALLLAPGDVDLLAGLASASYLAQDVETGMKAVNKALALRPNHQEALQTASFIYAAAGKADEAQKYFGQLKQIADQRTVNYVEGRLQDWKRIHTGDRFTQLASLKDGHHVAPAAPNNMALVDVIILRTEESGTQQEGNNVLKQLFAGVGPLNWSSAESKQRNFVSNQAGIDGVLGAGAAAAPGFPASPFGLARHAEAFTITKAFGLNAFNYALNIANTINKSSEVIARPTLVALDGKMSSFFSGNQLTVGLTGTIGGGQLDREKIGVHLEFIPKFMKDGRVEFAISVGRSFPERNLTDGFEILPGLQGLNSSTSSPFAATFQTALGELSANVVLEFGQTLILAGISERELVQRKEGFPILKDIPILQYVFSENKTVDYHKHLVVMMTPRKPGFRSSQEDPSDNADKPRRHLDRFLLAYVGDVQMEPNMKHVFAGLEQNAFFKEFRSGDVTEDRWFHTKNREYLIDQTLDMLYF